MCLILFAYQLRADLPLMLLANRDEYLDRATAPLAAWHEAPELIAGRDLVAGGTWLGCNVDGRWAAVTNVREGQRPTSGRPSRGWLVRDFLLGDEMPEPFAQRLAGRAREYAGFNLLLGGGGELWHVGNCGLPPRKLPAGIYGLSNGRLDSPWPKVERGKAALAALLGESLPRLEKGFGLLADRETFPDHLLPATGVALTWERVLSATFIAAPEHGYGTRSSTALMQTAGGRAVLIERTFAGNPERWSQRSCQLSARNGGSPLPAQNTCSAVNKRG